MVVRYNTHGQHFVESCVTGIKQNHPDPRPVAAVAAGPDRRPRSANRPITSRHDRANPYGVGPHTAHVMVHSAIKSQSRARHYRAWDDAPARVKTATLLLVSLVGGVLIGMVEAWSGYQMWPLILGVTALAVAVLLLAQRWVHEPLERVLCALERASNEGRVTGLQDLPLARKDEIGRLARIMHKVYGSAARDWHEARRLRRDLDHRVQKATEQATWQLRRMAMRDPLTEVGNRRFLEANLPALIESARASGTDLVCVAVDVDNFKPVNDTFGHAAGDELLIFLASLMQASIRSEDYVIRLGGDEFVILMPGADVKRASRLGGQLITLFRQHAATVLRGKIASDLSIGIASLRRDGPEDGEALLAQADENLYEAKRQGKGCVIGGEPAG